MNTMLLFLSTDREKKPRNEYKYRDTPYKGSQTCDAPVCCLMDQGRKAGKPIDQILVIVTEEVMHLKVVDDKTTLERFADIVAEAAAKSGYDSIPEIIPISYKNSSLPTGNKESHDFSRGRMSSIKGCIYAG